MTIIRALGLLASAVMLLGSTPSAYAQHLVGGMGEPIQLGAFDTHADARTKHRNPPEKKTAQARGPRDAGMAEANGRYAKPTLPGRHLR